MNAVKPPMITPDRILMAMPAATLDSTMVVPLTTVVVVEIAPGAAVAPIKITVAFEPAYKPTATPVVIDKAAPMGLTLFFLIVCTVVSIIS